MDNQDELIRLQEVKEMLKGYFAGIPDIEINVDGEHGYLYAENAFILSFDHEGCFTLSFEEDTNPLLVVNIVEMFLSNNIEYELKENFYFSPSDNQIYHGAEIASQKVKDTFGGKFSLKKYQGRIIQ